jgi:hypothetical protein
MIERSITMKSSAGWEKWRAVGGADDDIFVTATYALTTLFSTSCCKDTERLITKNPIADTTSWPHKIETPEIALSFS